MRILAFALITCLACHQSAQAATTALTESLLEYEAITDFIGAPGFTTIGPDESIVDIQRLTPRVNILGIVEYEICTRPAMTTLNRREGHNTYIATLNVAPNPGIGPNIVTVLSIEECLN